jgi:hypothetical protein
LAAFITKLCEQWKVLATLRAIEFKPFPALEAKFGQVSVFKLAFWALHFSPPLIKKRHVVFNYCPGLGIKWLPYLFQREGWTNSEQVWILSSEYLQVRSIIG